MTRTRGQVVAGAVGAGVLLPAALGGTYGTTAWGVTALGFLGVAVLGLRARPALGGLERVCLGGLVALSAWQLASLVWTASVPLTALEPQRTLVYLAALSAALLGLRSLDARATLVGAFIGSVAITGWNLVDRIGADTSLTGEGAAPIGYANGVGLVAAIGLVLAVGLALGRSGPALAAYGAGGTVLVAALWLSESRAAVLALTAGLLALALAVVGRPAVGVAAGAGLGVTAVLVAGRLTSAEREAYWRVAVDSWGDAPLHGGGAGTWWRSWLELRPAALPARDAHSLYLETLSELGLVGLAALLAVLVPLIVAAARGRTPVAATGGAGFVVLVVHMAGDWSWELPGAAAPGLACGAAVLLGLRPPAARPVRAGVVAIVAAAAALAVAVLLAGNVSTERAAAALRDGRAAAALGLADRAALLQPWAAEPLRVRAEAARALGDPQAARFAVAEALDRDPGDPELWRLLAALADGEERADALTRARSLDPHGGS